MDIVFLIVLGFVAGTLGGMLGIGGSVIMIPAMSYILGMPFHLAQAVAMTVNPAVAVSAAAKHHRNHNICWSAVRRVLPMSIVCIGIAAWLSNKLEGNWLELFFGVFLIWVLWDQICYIRGKSSHNGNDPKSTITRCSITGGISGTTAGLLGIGGGLIQVPLLNTLCRIPMKRAIGTSSAIMFITAIIGAIVKDTTLPNVISENNGIMNISGIEAFVGLLPGALLGGWCGAKLTNVLPVKFIRIVFALLATIASIKMLTTATASLF